MANWWRFTIEQSGYSHWFQIHPSRMDKMDMWIDKMIKRYPEMKIHISEEMGFDVNYCVEWDSDYNLIKLTQNNYEDPNCTYDFVYVNSNTYYFKEFPHIEVNIRKIKLEKINKICIK